MKPTIMASIIDGKFVRDEMTKNAMGGTELLAHRLVNNVDTKLMKGWQIHQSRVGDRDSSKRQILWCHDLAEDPAVAHLGKDDGWKMYDKIVFVSSWQQEQYKIYHDVPYSHGVVIPNAIEAIEEHQKPQDETIRLIYTSTPHRGLTLLFAAFEVLAKRYPNIHLDVYSSFKLYGWGERDKQFNLIFDKCNNHPQVTYHGSQTNTVVRKALKRSDIFAYPSIWKETSCLCLIEAMSAGLQCVHSNLAALPETSMGLTNMYGYVEDPQEHVNIFAAHLDSVIRVHQQHLQNRTLLRNMLNYPKPVIDSRYDIEAFKKRWTALLTMLS